MNLNYHHLRYFREVCRWGGVTRAAAELRVAQSSISLQLRQLENAVGAPLFDRLQKRLELTETGALVLDYCERIFSTGEELEELLSRRGRGEQRVLRVGVVATLSRNFVLRFLEPLLGEDAPRFSLRSGPMRELVAALRAHQLDVVLANAPVASESAAESGTAVRSHLLDEQPVSLVGPRGRRSAPRRFPEGLQDLPVILPGAESAVRQAFDLLCDEWGVTPQVVAEADDMALLRLLARDSGHATLVPVVVVADELRQKCLREWHRFANLRERFYAIVPRRKFFHPWLAQLLPVGRPRNAAD